MSPTTDGGSVPAPNESVGQAIEGAPVLSPIEPPCMDRLQFASEAVLSEVADMYPAC
jgi:hypothetical protein